MFQDDVMNNLALLAAIVAGLVAIFFFGALAIPVLLIIAAAKGNWGEQDDRA